LGSDDNPVVLRVVLDDLVVQSAHVVKRSRSRFDGIRKMISTTLNQKP
jgi:hypothetical protein